MRITMITVSGSRSIPNPADIRRELHFGVTLTADIDSNDDPQIASLSLQAQGEMILDGHQARLVEQAMDDAVANREARPDPFATTAAEDMINQEQATS